MSTTYSRACGTQHDCLDGCEGNGGIGKAASLRRAKAAAKVVLEESVPFTRIGPDCAKDNCADATRETHKTKAQRSS